MNSTHFIWTHSCPIIMRQLVTHSTEIGLCRDVFLRSVRINNRFPVIGLTTRIFEILRRIHRGSTIGRGGCAKILRRRRLAIAFTVDFGCALCFTLLGTSCCEPAVRCIYKEGIRKMFFHTT